MNDKDELSNCELEVKRLEAELEKYKNAHEYMNDYWDSFISEQQRQINKDLNGIFGKGHKEYLDGLQDSQD